MTSSPLKKKKKISNSDLGMSTSDSHVCCWEFLNWRHKGLRLFLLASLLTPKCNQRCSLVVAFVCDSSTQQQAVGVQSAAPFSLDCSMVANSLEGPSLSEGDHGEYEVPLGFYSASCSHGAPSKETLMVPCTINSSLHLKF